MKLRNIKTIISREYMTRVRKKSFLLITFLGPIFFAAVCVLPALIMQMTSEEAKNVAVVDKTGIVAERLQDTDLIKFAYHPVEALDSLTTNMKDTDVDILLEIEPGVDEISVKAVASSLKPISVDSKKAISDQINEAVEEYRLEQKGHGDLKAILEEVEFQVPMDSYKIDENGERTESSPEVLMVVSLALAMIIYIFIVMFSGMLMQSVIEEKASRVVEVLVSSVKATELMFGKIIGVACVAITQFFLWIVLTLGLVYAVSSFVGMDTLMGSATVQTEQMAQVTESMGIEAEEMIPTQMAEGGEMASVLTTLQRLDYGTLLLGFAIYFILGYLLYASFFAAIGSAVENEADTQQLQLPVTIPLMIGFFIAFYAFKAPDSAIVFWGSMIPFTSPIVMLARIPFDVPTWELALSMGILLVTFIMCGWASAKIYKIGILMFGKKTSFKDLWKWLKQK